MVSNFRRVIDAQIRQRPYFLPILSPAALKRCREANDLLCKEHETAVQAERRVVPIVTTEFDRREISECLPEPLAFLQLQAQMQGEQARFTAFSNLLKAKHDEVRLAIFSIR